jgi:Flp pilus assembly pilin Flp
MKKAFRNSRSAKLWSARLWSDRLWSDEEGQDVAEYSVMLAVILVIVVGTVRLIGSNAGNIFSQVGSSIQ